MYVCIDFFFFLNCILCDLCVMQQLSAQDKFPLKDNKVYLYLYLYTRCATVRVRRVPEVAQCFAPCLFLMVAVSISTQQIEWAGSQTQKRKGESG